MAYDEGLATRIRDFFEHRPDVAEKKMFGGLCFMAHGNMCCGVVASELMLRVGPGQYESTLAMEHARELDFTGRPMRGMVMINEGGIEEDEALANWINLAMAFTDTLPSK